MTGQAFQTARCTEFDRGNAIRMPGNGIIPSLYRWYQNVGLVVVVDVEIRRFGRDLIRGLVRGLGGRLGGQGGQGVGCCYQKSLVLRRGTGPASAPY